MECWFKLKFNFLPISLMAEILAHSVSKFFSFFAVEEYNTKISTTKIFSFHQCEL